MANGNRSPRNIYVDYKFVDDEKGWSNGKKIDTTFVHAIMNPNSATNKNYGRTNWRSNDIVRFSSTYIISIDNPITDEAKLRLQFGFYNGMGNGDTSKMLYSGTIKLASYQDAGGKTLLPITS